MFNTHIFMKDKYGFKKKMAINKKLIHLTNYDCTLIVWYPIMTLIPYLYMCAHNNQQ
jgi:hypothetical protein